MIPILSGNVSSGLATGYDIANSCQFNDGNTRLTRSFSAGNQALWTLSMWVKRSGLGQQSIFSAFNDSQNKTVIRFTSNDELFFSDEDSNNENGRIVSNAKYRDIAAWLHLVFHWDSSDSTSTDRLRMYVNGERITSFSDTGNYPTTTSNVNENGITHEIGSLNSADYFDGYMAEIFFIGGQNYNPSVFAENDEDSPTIWKPKDCKDDLDFSAANSFYLDFADSGDMGDDESGEGNDWTEDNCGGQDQTTDTPTNNFATLNPLYHYIGGAVLSKGNLKFTTSGNSSLGRAISTIRPESGKWYVECKVIDVTRFNIGLMNGNETNSAQGGEDTNSVILGYGGSFYMAGSFTGYLSSLSNNDIVQLALDLDNDLFWFGVNDTWGNSATRTEIENGTATNSGSTDISSQVPINTGAIGIFLEDNSGTGNNVAEINFGSPSFAISSGNADANGYGNFEYAVPSGYYALCTKNLAEFG